MTCHYPDLGSASDWSCCKWNLPQSITSTTQIWVVLLIGRAESEICFNQSESLPRSGQCFWLIVLLVKFASTNQKHYPDLGTTSDWSCCLWNLLQPIRSATQIWVVLGQGVFTWHRGDFREFTPVPSHGSTFVTWYHHKKSCRRESPRSEFTPVVAPRREFHSSTKSRNGIM